MCTWSHSTLYFFQEQAADEAVAAADEAVAAAKKEFYEAILNKCTMEDILEAKEHYESAVATLAKFRTVGTFWLNF